MNFIIALLWLIVSGAFIGVVLAGRDWRGRFAELLPLSFFLGAGYVSFQFLTLYLFGEGFDLINVVVVPGFMLLMLAVVWASGRRDAGTGISSTGGRLNTAGKALLAGIIVQFVWVLIFTLPMPVHSHDAVANYALKAKIFDMAGGIPAAFFGWSEYAVAHPDYPPLLPFLMTWVYRFTGFSYFGVNALMPVVYAAFLALFYSLMRRRFNSTYSLLAAFVLATIPQAADYSTIMYADLPFAALVTCGTMYLAQYMRGGQRADLLLASALFGISLWTKNEAMVFAGCFWAVLVVFFARTERQNKRTVAGELATAFLLMALIAAPWFAAKASAAANCDLDMTKLTFGRLMQNIRDIPIFLNLFQQEVFGPKKWNIFWVIFFAAIIWKRKMLWKGEIFYLTLFIALAFAGYFSAYMMITGVDLYFCMNTTISRFMLHFCGIALFLMANLVYGDMKELESFRDKG